MARVSLVSPITTVQLATPAIVRMIPFARTA